MENKDFLYILPFDHRTGLFKEFGWTEPLTGEQVTAMKDGRMLIFEAIKSAVAQGIPKENAPVFTDDIFGEEVLLQAKQEEFKTFLTTEKSGTPYFDFEHGDQFAEYIEKIKPTAVKALVRYNPELNKENNEKSLVNLKKLSDYAHEHDYKFVIEPLIPEATDATRPDLVVKMINEMHTVGIKPHVWKIEGFDNTESYQKIVAVAEAGVICLGRNESDAVVESWLKAGAQVPGVIGFAIGRTIFLEPLKNYIIKRLSRDEAITQIAEKFLHFYKVFTGK